MTAIFTSQEGRDEVLRRYHTALREWPVPAEHLRVATRQGETFVVASGPRDAPPLILLHGSGANTMTWTGDVAAWSRHWRVLAVDMVGEPGLSAPSRPRLDSDAVALWLDDVLEGLGISGAAFVGMSLGGWTALDYASRRPERVRRLALLCPGGIGRQTRAKLVVRAVLTKLCGRERARRSVAATAGLEIPRDQAVLDFVVLVFRHFRPRTERLPVFGDDTLRDLSMPVQVIVGGRDVMFDSHDTVRRVSRCVPHAQVTLLPEAGHAILGQTDTVAAFLRG